jgi:hypothetical protein
MAIPDNYTDLCAVNTFKWNWLFKLFWTMFFNFTQLYTFCVWSTFDSKIQDRVCIWFPNKIEEILLRISSFAPDHSLVTTAAVFSSVSQVCVPAGSCTESFL